MTLKQKLTLKDLPANNFVLSKAMRKNGYKESSINSGTVRKQILNNLDREIFSEEFIKKQYKKTLKESSNVKDLTNKLRALEGMARIKAMFTDKTLNKSTVVIEQEEKSILDKYIGRGVTKMAGG